MAYVYICYKFIKSRQVVGFCEIQVTMLLQHRYDDWRYYSISELAPLLNKVKICTGVMTDSTLGVV